MKLNYFYIFSIIGLSYWLYSKKAEAKISESPIKESNNDFDQSPLSEQNLYKKQSSQVAMGIRG